MQVHWAWHRSLGFFSVLGVSFSQTSHKCSSTPTLPPISGSSKVANDLFLVALPSLSSCVALWGPAPELFSPRERDKALPFALLSGLRLFFYVITAGEVPQYSYNIRPQENFRLSEASFLREERASSPQARLFFLGAPALFSETDVRCLLHCSLIACLLAAETPLRNLPGEPRRRLQIT